MKPHETKSGQYVNYTTHTSSDGGAVYEWPTAREDSIASLSRDSVILVGMVPQGEALPFPDKDISPTLQRLLKRKFDEADAGGELETVDKDEFFKLLGRTAEGEEADSSE